MDGHFKVTVAFWTRCGKHLTAGVPDDGRVCCCLVFIATPWESVWSCCKTCSYSSFQPVDENQYKGRNKNGFQYFAMELAITCWTESTVYIQCAWILYYVCACVYKYYVYVRMRPHIFRSPCRQLPPVNHSRTQCSNDFHTIVYFECRGVGDSSLSVDLSSNAHSHAHVEHWLMFQHEKGVGTFPSKNCNHINTSIKYMLYKHLSM